MDSNFFLKVTILKTFSNRILKKTIQNIAFFLGSIQYKIEVEYEIYIFSF